MFWGDEERTFGNKTQEGEGNKTREKRVHCIMPRKINYDRRSAAGRRGGRMNYGGMSCEAEQKALSNRKRGWEDRGGESQLDREKGGLKSHQG